MRSLRADAGDRERQHRRNGGEAEDGQRQDQHRQHGVLHLAAFDLLAEQFRRAADHQPGDEDRQDREHQHAVEARADAAGQHFAELDQEHRHQAAEPVNEPCMPLTPPSERPVVAAA